jgi:hypothetical protein
VKHYDLFVAFAQPHTKEMEMLQKSYWGQRLVGLGLGIVAVPQRMN